MALQLAASYENVFLYRFNFFWHRFLCKKIIPWLWVEFIGEHWNFEPSIDRLQSFPIFIYFFPQNIINRTTIIYVLKMSVEVTFFYIKQKIFFLGAMISCHFEKMKKYVANWSFNFRDLYNVLYQLSTELNSAKKIQKCNCFFLLRH